MVAQLQHLPWSWGVQIYRYGISNMDLIERMDIRGGMSSRGMSLKVIVI